MKKYISILLSFIMIFNLSTPVFAASNVVSLPSTYQERSIIPLSDGSKNRLEILSSSDTNTHKLKEGEEFFIQEFKNNQLIHTVQGTYGGNSLICTDYENNQITNQKIIDIADRVTITHNDSNNITPIASHGSVLGHIIYNKDIGNTVPGEDLTIYSKITNQDSESYIINGAVSDLLSDISGIILSVLFSVISTANVAQTIAIAIVSYYGGNILGGKIGVAFSEPVAVEATYYTLTGYHSASNYYTAGHKGVERLVKTKKSNSYNKWFYEGYTPHNWKKGDDFATILWMSVFARPFPYVYAYR